MQRGSLGEFYAREIGRVYEDAGIPDVGAVFQDGDSGGHKLPEFAHRRGFERLVRDFAHKRRKQLYFVHAVGGRIYRALEFLHPKLAVYPQPVLLELAAQRNADFCGFARAVFERAAVDDVGGLEVLGVKPEGFEVFAEAENRLDLSGADFARETLELDLERAVKCSNYIGEAFDHAVVCGYPEILLVGHAGKLVKLAAGVMNTHSSVADARQEIFTAHAALCGAGRETLELLMQAVSVDACIELLDREGVRESVMARIQDEMEKRIARRLKGRAAAEFIMFTTKYGVLAQSAGAARLCEKLRKNL